MNRFLLFGIIIALFTTGCVRNDKWHKTEGAVWNTLYHITYRSDVNLDDSIIAVMRSVELSLSPFEKNSTISRINRNETDSIDCLIAKVFEFSKSLNSLSAGMFDPTVAPLVNLWGFGYIKTEKEVPSPEEIAAIMPSIGIADCSINGTTINKKAPDTEFNFSAITKGLGCDMLGEMFCRNGCRDFMIEIGGEIVLKGKNPRGTRWHIMVDAPEPSDSIIIHKELTTLDLTDCGIATSGNYRNYRDTAAGRVSHTINPLTGYPIMPDASDTTILSATAIAPSCMEADAIATATMAMKISAVRQMISKMPGTRVIVMVNPPDTTPTLISIPD